MFTGTISIEKENLIELLYGFKIFLNESHKDCELIFYGYIVFNEKKILDKLISELNLQENIIFKGRIELKGLLEKYHVLCHLNPKDLGYSFEKDNKNIQTNFLTNLESIGTDFDYYVTNEECYANNYRESAFIKPEII